MTGMIHYSGGLVFVWYGGVYIDIYAEQDFDVKPDQMRHNDHAPYEVINVWDYAQDRATISTMDEFRNTCEYWLNSRERDVEDETDNADLAYSLSYPPE